MATPGGEKTTFAGKHCLVFCGTLMWCHQCGACAEDKAKGLGRICNGPPVKERHWGGMRGQLNKLLLGKHLKTGELLPQAQNADGSVWKRGSGAYGRLTSASKEVQPPALQGFIRYEPAIATVARPKVGVPASVNMQERLERIKLKEASVGNSMQPGVTRFR